VPELLSENLNALKARSVSVKSGKGNHCAVYVPILGRWYQDTPAYYAIPVGERTVSLFSTDVQESINILDGMSGSDPVDINNSYYSIVIQNWNSHVSALKGYSSTVGPLMRDRGPLGLPLILTTIEERVSPIQDVKAAPIAPIILDNKYVTNVKPVKNSVKDAQGKVTKNVQYVPAATTTQLDQETLYTMLPNGDSELITLMDSLILPSIRFNRQEPGDVLNSQMWQVHTRFANSMPLANFYNVGTQSKYARLNRLSSFCITGIGRDENDQYARLMKTLCDKGKASGLLTILSGLVGAIFPPLAPVVGAVAGALDH
jgi:hypothetical protein